jgi:hypothetical protein
MSILNVTGLYSITDCDNLSVKKGNFNAPSGTTFGETATQSCNVGYTLSLSGDETVICLESRNKNAIAVVCTVVGKCDRRDQFYVCGDNLNLSLECNNVSHYLYNICLGILFN